MSEAAPGGPPTEHGYPWRSMGGDLVRAVVGAALGALPLVLIDLEGWVAAVLAGVAALFSCFGLITLVRGRTRIRVDEQAIAVVAPWSRCIEWDRLDGLTLSYYSTGSRADQGWMQLVVRSGRRRIGMDSRLSGFREIAERALRAARSNQVLPDPATLANFRALGLTSHGPGNEVAPGDSGAR